MLALNRARLDEFNPDQPRGPGGQWGGGGASQAPKAAGGTAPGQSASLTRVERAKAEATRAATKAGTAVERHLAAQGKQRASKEAAVVALKESKTAARIAKRTPTPDNVREWQAATKKAISARDQAARHTSEAILASSAHAKAQTAHALAQANLREAHRAAAAPVVVRAKAVEVHPRGIGWERIREEPKAPPAPPPPPHKETVLEMLSRTKPNYVHQPKPRAAVDPVAKRQAEIASTERARKSAETKLRAQRAIGLAGIPGVSAVSLPYHHAR
jgi:hypothetical protein